MIHHLAHLNWGGILFVVGILPASGLATELLRRWGNRVDGRAERGKIRGDVRATNLPWGESLSHDSSGLVWRPANAIDSSGYKVMKHECVFEVVRSRVVSCADGTVEISCAVHGCEGRKLYPAGVLEALQAWRNVG